MTVANPHVHAVASLAPDAVIADDVVAPVSAATSVNEPLFDVAVPKEPEEAPLAVVLELPSPSVAEVATMADVAAVAATEVHPMIELPEVELPEDVVPPLVAVAPKLRRKRTPRETATVKQEWLKFCVSTELYGEFTEICKSRNVTSLEILTALVTEFVAFSREADAAHAG